jgi:hypothetical protein
LDFDPDYHGSDSSMFSNITGKKLALLVGLICIGAFLVVQAMFGFPIKDLFRADVSDEETVIIKNDLQKTCVVEGLEHQPRVITECSYEKGDKIVVSYKQGTSSISSHHLK